VTLTLLATPLVAATPPEGMTELVIYGRYLASEALVGVLLGFGLTLFLTGVQLAGQIISQIGGTAISDVFDPNLNDTVSVFSQFFYFLTLAMFVMLDGHRIVIDALLDTYRWLPPGQASLGDSYVEVLVSLLSQSFVLGIRTAAPTMAALLLATLVLGLVGRTLPQINILAVGFGVNSLLTLGCLFASLGAVAWAFPEQGIAAVEQIQQALSESAGP
jgi:flagellar biosynthetic protein FliR